MEVRDQYIELRGLQFHYREWGEPSHPTVVFLHGILVSSASYDALIEGFCGDRHVLALDQRGHGETDHAGDYSWEQWVEDIAAFSDSLSLSPFHLVGHSTGADNAARFAGRHPDRVRRLILLEGGIGPTDGPGQDQFWADAANLMPEDGFESSEAFVDLAFELFPRADKSAIARWTPWLRQGVDQRWRWTVSPDIAAFGIDRPGLDEEQELRQRTPGPVLVVHSEHSELFTDDNFRDIAAQYEHGRAELLPRAGHMVMWENVTGSTALIGAFLSD